LYGTSGGTRTRNPLGVRF